MLDANTRASPDHLVVKFLAAHSTSVALARRNSIRPRPSTRVALGARTNLQVRNPAKIKTTLRRQNHPRHPLPRRLKNAPDPAVLLYNDAFFLLRLRQGNTCEKESGT